MIAQIAHNGTFCSKLIEEMRQWRIEDLEKYGHNRGCGGKAPRRPGLTGSGSVAPGRQQIVAFSHEKLLTLAHFFMEKGHAVSAATIV